MSVQIAGMESMNKFIAKWWPSMNDTKWYIVSDVKILGWWLQWFSCKVNILKFKEIHQW